MGTDEAKGPVSYTPLRAHETVLDLVCRLLVEKKKSTDKAMAHNMVNTTEDYTTQWRRNVLAYVFIPE